MISASALAPNCAYAKVLSAKKPRPASTVEAADRGTLFHAAVELWVRGGQLPEVNDLEIQGWLDLLASNLDLRCVAAEVEVAWGLGAAGEYIAVDEPEPHKYVARDGRELLTAGRADLVMPIHNGASVAVFDWKTGKWPVTPAADNLQVNAAGIALLARARNTRPVQSYIPAVYYARDGAMDMGDPVVIGSREHAEMFARVREAALLPLEPRPGRHCERCWERKQCPQAAT